MNGKFAFSLLVAVLLTACGPIFGQMMEANNGIKEFTVEKGTLGDLKRGESILVYGPFDKTDDAFYICRGEDAAHFAAELRKSGFNTELYIEHTFKNLQKTAQGLRHKTPEQLREDLQLDILPDKILFGTILHRQFSVAPTKGVEVNEGFRLEFLDPKTGRSIIVEISDEELVQNSVPTIVAEILKHG